MPIHYVVRRILLAVPVLLGVITISFWVTIAVPGDPLAGLLPEDPTPEQYRRVASEFGLDQPVIVQWWRYVVRTVQGDLGKSLRTRRQVTEDLSPAVTATLELALVAFVVMVMLGIPMGVAAAVREDTLADHVLSILSIGGMAAPIFWIALMAQLVLYGHLDWLPAGSRVSESILLRHPFATPTGFYLLDTLLAGNLPAFVDVAKHLLLPAVVLAYAGMGLVVRITRAAMLEVLRSPYILTARALGLPRRRITYFHALKNALPPTLTVVGLAFGHLLQGSILVETVFNWPGLGLYTIQSVIRLDYPGIIAVSIVITTVYVFANLAIDIAYAMVDPRIRM
jgi:peptide/nickel transport system permease protein